MSDEVVHTQNSRAGGWEFPATLVFGQRMKVYGEQTEHGEVVLIRRWWTKETSWQDVSLFGRPRARPCKDMPRRKRSEEPLSGCVDLINKTLTHVCHNGERAHTFLCDLEPNNKCARQVSENYTQAENKRRRGQLDGDRNNKGRGLGSENGACLSTGTRGFDWTSRSKLLVWWKGTLVRC